MNLRSAQEKDIPAMIGLPRQVGKLLYDHACACARQRGCQTATLNVWCGNESAMAFYEKQGLKPRNIYMETRLEDDHAE